MATKVNLNDVRIKSIRQFTRALDDCVVTLRSEAEEGNLYSGLQADVIEPISKKLKEIVGGNYGKTP